MTGPRGPPMIDFCPRPEIIRAPAKAKEFTVVFSRATLAAAAVATASPVFIASAFAQSAADAAADAAIACLDIAEPAERLACLESATREIAATRIRSETAEDSAAADARRVYADENATEEESFGAEALPSVKSAKREKDRKQSLEAAVIEFRVNPFGDITAILQNGQEWKQLSSDNTIIRLPRSEKVFTVTIKKGPIGGYMMRINELKRAIRVRRIK